MLMVDCRFYFEQFIISLVTKEKRRNHKIRRCEILVIYINISRWNTLKGNELLFETQTEDCGKTKWSAMQLLHRRSIERSPSNPSRTCPRRWNVEIGKRFLRFLLAQGFDSTWSRRRTCIVRITSNKKKKYTSDVKKYMRPLEKNKTVEKLSRNCQKNCHKKTVNKDCHRKWESRKFKSLNEYLSWCLFRIKRLFFYENRIRIENRISIVCVQKKQSLSSLIFYVSSFSLLILTNFWKLKLYS